jgi:hypothetical protein
MVAGSVVSGRVRLFTKVKDTNATWAVKTLSSEARMKIVNDTTAN